MNAANRRRAARTNESALFEQGAGISKRYKANYTLSIAMELHRVLNLAADSAIDADDAITRKDTERLSKAVSALAINATIARALARVWGAMQ